MKKTTTCRAPSTARFVLPAVLIILFLLFPYAASDGVKKGLSICAETLIPSLFPYTVISELLVRFGLGAYSARFLGRPMKSIFGVSGACSGALLLGILCGFPIGAKTASQLYEKGDISKEDAERVLAFCNLPSPPFMIFAVGRGLFSSEKIGIILYISVLSANLIIGILSGSRRRKMELCRTPVPIKSESAAEAFTASVISAAGTLISVCAYVSFFTCAVGCLTELFSETPQELKVLLFSFFELTSGAAGSSMLNNIPLGILICSAAAGWSGLSVFCQIRALTGTLSLKPYFVSKVAAAIISPIITLSIIKLTGFEFISKAPDTDAFLHLRLLPSALISAVDTIFILSLLFYLLKKLDRSPRI